MITPRERRLQVLLRILAIAFALATLGYLVPALVGPLQPFYIQLPFVTNSVVKVSVLALLALIAAEDVRRFRVLILLILWGHAVSEVAMLAVLLWGTTDYYVEVANRAVPIRHILYGAMVLDGLILVVLATVFKAAERSRYALRYLSPMQFRALVALADVMVEGTGEILTPEEVARNVDTYLSKFRAQSKWLLKLALSGIQLYPLLSCHVPFSYMSTQKRSAFIQRRFYQDITQRLTPSFWRTLVQAMIRVGQQLCFLGYYKDERTFESVGYVPFSRRPDSQDKLAKHPPRRRPLRVTTPAEVDSDTIVGDVVIVGSGAAGSILADGLTEAGRDVLLLERGAHMDPSQFTEDEAEMLSRLYADGAIQLTRDFRFQILQGSCVGGTTVVNNAVCFDLSAGILERWNDPDGLDAGLDPDRLKDSFSYVRKVIGVELQAHENLNRSAPKITASVRRLGLDRPPNSYLEVEANINGCHGCGYCNIGCRFGRKLSMLDVVLPNIQQRYAEGGSQRLKIVAECEARSLRARGRRVTEVFCRLSDGRRVRVRGNVFVVSAGAVSSSLLLLRSQVGGSRVGKRLAFNMGSPMTGRFPHIVNAYEGLQISHFLELFPGRGYIIETWFNPPVAQALTMPGWFNEHFNNMRAYNRMAALGVLAGTEANAQVRRAGWIGREIDYTPTPRDLRKLIDGLVLAGEILFEAGADRVLPSTFTYHEFKTREELHELPHLVRDASDITLGTGHPQGGNALSRNPELGVVDQEFGVYGYDNLFVCDASVFPSSIGVNPQLTVMALAHYAVPFIAERNGPSR